MHTALEGNRQQLTPISILRQIHFNLTCFQISLKSIDSSEKFTQNKYWKSVSMLHVLCLKKKKKSFWVFSRNSMQKPVGVNCSKKQNVQWNSLITLRKFARSSYKIFWKSKHKWSVQNGHLNLCFMLNNFSLIREFHCRYMHNCSRDLSEISSFSICKSNESTKHYCHQQKRDTQTNKSVHKIGKGEENISCTHHTLSL